MRQRWHKPIIKQGEQSTCAKLGETNLVHTRDSLELAQHKIGRFIVTIHAGKQYLHRLLCSIVSLYRVLQRGSDLLVVWHNKHCSIIEFSVSNRILMKVGRVLLHIVAISGATHCFTPRTDDSSCDGDDSSTGSAYNNPTSTSSQAPT
jgi:hypothetical protein